MITIENVSKVYGNRYVLNNISLSLPDKGLISILGKSGSGKSTLLNLIGGLDKPTFGKIYIDGIDLNIIDKDYYHFYHTAFIFQNYNLIPNLSLKENLCIVKNTDLSILDKFSLSGKENTKAKNLSGGEAQRCAIARAIS